VPARYVTVIDRVEGCVKYFYLDAKGCLIFDNGMPRLCKTEPYGAPPVQATQPIETNVGMESDSPRPSLDGSEETFGGDGSSFAEFFGFIPEGEFVAYEMGNPYLL
jgi:hypothetical protein